MVVVLWLQGAASLHNQYMHLTNYSINKHSSKFVQNHDASADDTGSKWSLSALRRHLTRCGVNVTRLNSLIDELIVKTLVAVEPGVTASCRRYCAHRNSCFELLGFDVLIDDCLKPWLLEVRNLAPRPTPPCPLTQPPGPRTSAHWPSPSPLGFALQPSGRRLAR